jgi:hypothetical protein
MRTGNNMDSSQIRSGCGKVQEPLFSMVLRISNKYGSLNSEKIPYEKCHYFEIT